jgi:hypothetical protein
MKKIYFSLVCFLFCGCAMLNTAGSLQIDKILGDFTLSGDIKTFGAINIKDYNPQYAPVFIEFGVDSLFVMDYEKNGEKFTVEIYSFRTPKGAYGTYFLLEEPESKPLNIPQYSRISKTSVDFVKGTYLTSVKPADVSGLGNAQVLAAGLSERIQGGAFKTDLFYNMPQQNLVKDTEIYFAGPRGFECRFPEKLGKDLYVEFAVDGLSAIYSMETYEVDFIKIKFNGRKETLEAMDHFLETKRVEKCPIIHSNLNPVYYTVIEKDKTETYIAESGDILLVIIGGMQDGKARSLFEYIARRSF